MKVNALLELSNLLNKVHKMFYTVKTIKDDDEYENEDGENNEADLPTDVPIKNKKDEQ